MTLFAAHRAVEVLRHNHTTDTWRVGSGGLVGGTLVLTTAHNVEPTDDSSVRVRFVDGSEHDARVLAAGPPDLAILEVDVAGLDVAPVPFGRIDRTTPSTVTGCWAVGFPGWKEIGKLRETVQVDGVIPTASNLRRGLLELRTDATPLALATAGRSEWQGMSGAVVYAPGRLPTVVGVVIEHHLAEGSSSLTVAPVTGLAGLGAGQAWWRRLGVEPWVHIGPRASAPVRTHHLRLARAKSHFTNRTDELARIGAWLDRDLADGVAVIVIHGMGGVGKSELANQAAHRLGERFPHARVRVDLGGGEGPPVSGDAAIVRLLHAFGVTGAAVPADPDERYRRAHDLLAEGPCLLVLDNATAAAQVEPLLPVVAGSAALVTSRDPLRPLEGADRVALEPLDPEHGLRLFDRVRGVQTPEADHADGLALIALFGGLPLAVRIAAAASTRARLRGRPIRELRAAFADEDHRLSTLDDEERAVRACFDVGYRLLDNGSARLFRALGLLPVVDFQAELVAHAAQVPSADLLDDLVDRQLVELVDPAARRYRLHELVRLYARERALDEDGRQWSRDVRRRAAAWFAERLTRLTDHKHSAEVPSDETLAWTADEQLNLATVARAVEELAAWDLALALSTGLYGPLWYRGRWAELAAVTELGVRAARELGDAQEELNALIHLAEALRAVDRAAETVPLYARAEDLARGLDQPDRLGWVLAHHGDLHCDLGEPDRALEIYARAEALHREHENVGARIWLAAHVADAQVQAHRPHEAVAVLDEALALATERTNADEIAWCQWHRALALSDTGRHAAAVTDIEAAIAHHRAKGDRGGTATMLLALGRIQLAAGRPELAAGPLREALDLVREIQAPHREPEIEAELARCQPPTADDP